MGFAGQVEGTKKPAGLAPCGLSGLHQSTLVIADGEFWWGWRPCNYSFNILIYMYILCFSSIEGSIMEPLSEIAERLTSNYAER